MSRFVDNAVRIFETAEHANKTGHADSDWTILFTPEGGLRMVADSDWPLESLQAHFGAGMAYRVTQQESKLRIEGRAGVQTCLFEAAKPDGAARLLLNRQPAGNRLKTCDTRFLLNAAPVARAVLPSYA